MVVTKLERIVVILMVKARLWRLVNEMRLVTIIPKTGTAWLRNWMLHRQTVDDLHHAPCCPANHYHKQRLVFQTCACGALAQIKKEGN